MAINQAASYTMQGNFSLLSRYWFKIGGNTDLGTASRQLGAMLLSNHDFAGLYNANIACNKAKFVLNKNVFY